MTLELGRADGDNKELKSSSQASLLEVLLELRASVDLDGPDGERDVHTQA